MASRARSVTPVSHATNRKTVSTAGRFAQNHAPLLSEFVRNRIHLRVDRTGNAGNRTFFTNAGMNADFPRLAKAGLGSAPRGRQNQPIKVASATDGERAQVLIESGEI